MLVTGRFSVKTEFAIFVRKNVGPGAKSILVDIALEHPHGSLNVLPHQVLSAKLEALRKVVYLLIFAGILQLLRLGDMLISSRCGLNLLSKRMSKP